VLSCIGWHLDKKRATESAERGSNRTLGAQSKLHQAQNTDTTTKSRRKHTFTYSTHTRTSGAQRNDRTKRIRPPLPPPPVDRAKTAQQHHDTHRGPGAHASTTRAVAASAAAARVSRRCLGASAWFRRTKTSEFEWASVACVRAGV
jgi:hypothetical protein